MTWTKSLGRNSFFSLAIGGFLGLGMTLYWSRGKRYWKCYVHLLMVRATFGTRPLPKRLRGASVVAPPQQVSGGGDSEAA